MTINPDELITNADAAKLLKQQPQTLRVWRSQGKGPRFIKLGAQVFYTRLDIAEWLSGQVKDPERVSPK